MAGEMREDMLQILYSQEQLQNRVRELGAAITRDYAGRQPFFLGVLKGCFVFMADLLRAVDLPCELEFMAVKSYRGASSSGQPEITRDLTRNVEGMDIVIVEDILDTGVTLDYLRQYLLGPRKAASVRIVTMFDKEEGRDPALKGRIEADYVGFPVPKAFVVGYGLDYDERYRNLPYVGILKPEVYGQAAD